MVIGQKIESLVSLACARRGTFTDGTAFTPVDLGKVMGELESLGLRYNGMRRMYSGRTGRYFDCAIMLAHTYHQRLQKFVLDERYAVGNTGPTDATTNQPLEGKAVKGGLKQGHMEVWVMLSQGSMAVLNEKCYTDSDGRENYVCRACGDPAIYNEFEHIYRCNNCGEGADIYSLHSCRSAIVFHQEMDSSNVRVRHVLRRPEFQLP